MRMTIDAREAFLADVHVATLAVARPGRAPLAVPVWYDYFPGGDVRVWLDRGSVKEGLLREAGRFSLSVQVEQVPYRYVTVEGPVTWNESPTADDVTPIAARYLHPADVEPYVQAVHGPTSLIAHLNPERWLSSDLTEEFAPFVATLAAASLTDTPTSYKH